MKEDFRVYERFNTEKHDDYETYKVILEHYLMGSKVATKRKNIDENWRVTEYPTFNFGKMYYALVYEDQK